MIISKTLDKMLSKMEQSTDENQSVAAACLRIDATRWAEEQACFRCSKAVWMAKSKLPQTPQMGQPTQKDEFHWAMTLGACGAFLPVTYEFELGNDRIPDAPFFCSAETQEAEEAGNFASAAGERQATRAGLTEGEFPLPRARGE